MSKERIVLTYKDVVSGEAEKYVGKLGRFSDYLYEYNNYHWYYGSLDGFNHDNLQIPFVNSKIGCYQFFSPDPEPDHEYAPFTFDDAQIFRDKWITPKNDFPAILCSIVQYRYSGIVAMGDSELTFVGYKSLLDKYCFEDGTPCGKKVIK